MAIFHRYLYLPEGNPLILGCPATRILREPARGRAEGLKELVRHSSALGVNCGGFMGVTLWKFNRTMENHHDYWVNQPIILAIVKRINYDPNKWELLHWLVVWLPSILFSQEYWVSNHPN